MKKITAAMLEMAWACPQQRRLFRRTFPHGATVSAASMKKALEAGLTAAWLLYRLPSRRRAAVLAQHAAETDRHAEQQNEIATEYSDACTAAKGKPDEAERRYKAWRRHTSRTLRLERRYSAEIAGTLLQALRAVEDLGAN